MATWPKQPDVTQALVDFIAHHGDLTSLHGGQVGTRLQSNQTAVRVTALGGQRPWPWEYRPEFQIEWWGGTEQQANTLARTGEAALYDFVGPITGGRVTGVVIALSALWSPDDTTGRPRLITHTQYTVYPEAS